MRIVNGLGVSPGTARGRALVVRPRQQEMFYLVPSDRVEDELERMAAATRRSRAQLDEISARLARVAGPGPASLFEAQLLMLDDPLLVGRARQLVRDEQRNAEWALSHAADEVTAMLSQANDVYLRERHGDIRDVVGRLVMNLRGESRQVPLPAARDPWIIVADELSPSMAAQIDWRLACGFVSEAGSWTYHTAILARSLGIPAVMGVQDATNVIAPGTDLLLDGSTGQVLIDADAEARARIMERDRDDAIVVTRLVEGPLTTADGARVRIGANLELPDDLDDAIRSGAEGVGLFRSEFLLTADGTRPRGADSELAVYRDLLARSNDEVTFRTFDAKPDEHATNAADSPQRLGLRALIVDERSRAQFNSQIGLLLLASPAGRLRILLPFVTDVTDLRVARTLIQQAADNLRVAGYDIAPVPVGVMIEVPSAALTADQLAREADFLSIGTNDLIALTLAVARADEHASRFYDPLHPSILRLVRLVERAARRSERRLSVCGEMAAEPRTLIVLLGLGLREFSMVPSAIPRARQLVSRVSVAEARTIAADLLQEARDGALQRLDALVRSVFESPAGLRT